MGFNINLIKSEFLKYLADNDIISTKEQAEFNVNSSIFKYMNELTKFLKENKSSLGLPKDFKGTINEILNLNFENKEEEENDIYSGYPTNNQEEIKGNNPVLEKTYNKEDKSKNIIKNNYDKNQTLKSQEIDVYSRTGKAQSKYITEADETGDIETKLQYEYTDNTTSVAEENKNATPDGKIDYSEQGEMGDCWLLAALNSLSYTEQGKNILKNAITENADGTYSINIKGVNKSINITQEELNYAKNSDKYAKGDDDTILFELGFESIIKQIVSQETTIQGNHKGLTINKETNDNELTGGNLEDAIFLLTGNDVTSVFKEAGKTTEDFNKAINTLKQNPEKYAAIIGLCASEDSSLTLKDINGEKICTLSQGTNHAFSIKSVDEDGIVIVNPWDSSKEYKISFTDAQKYSTGIQYYKLDEDFKEPNSAKLLEDDSNSTDKVVKNDDSTNNSEEITNKEQENANQTGSTNSNDSASTTGSSGTSGASGSFGGNSGSSAPASSANSVTPQNTNVSTQQSIDNMTLDELEAKKNEKQGEVDKAQQDVNDVYSGKNEAVKNAESAEEAAKEEYDNLVEELLNNGTEEQKKLKQERTDNLDEIDKKETEINDKKTAINDKEAEITGQENVITSTESEISALADTISALEGQKSNGDDDASKKRNADIDAKISEAQAKKSELETKLKEEKSKLDSLNDDKTTLEEELTSLEDDLKSLEKTKSEIEEKIFKELEGDEKAQKQIKEASDKYNSARDEVKGVQQKEETKAKEVLSSKQDELQEINDQIDNKKAEELKSKYNPINGNLTVKEVLEKCPTIEDRIKYVAEIALQEYKTSGILPSVTIAQCMIESGNLESGLSTKANNCFGIKCGSQWTGSSINMKTGEYYNGYTTVNADFRAYNTIGESIEDHAKLLNNSRYQANQYNSDYKTQIQKIWSSGYATSPTYVNTICNYIEKYNLDKYDEQAKQNA